MSAVTLLFPHQLFEKHPALRKNQTVFIVEEFHFFKQYNFHKQKIVFHRASRKAYQRFLESKGYAVTYIEAKENPSIKSKIHQRTRFFNESGVAFQPAVVGPY